MDKPGVTDMQHLCPTQTQWPWGCSLDTQTLYAWGSRWWFWQGNETVSLVHNLFGKGRPWIKKVKETIIFSHLNNFIIFMWYLNREGAQQSRSHRPNLRLYDINYVDRQKNMKWRHKECFAGKSDKACWSSAKVSRNIPLLFCKCGPESYRCNKGK